MKLKSVDSTKVVHWKKENEENSMNKKAERYSLILSFIISDKFSLIRSN